MQQRWIVRPQPRPQAAIRLFCLPFAGAGAAAYAPWAARLPEEIELNAVLLPGRESRLREQPYTHLASLVSDLADGVMAELNRPYALFGHSVGAWMAFELARELCRRSARMPVYLFVSGRRAPHLPDRAGPLYDLPDAELVAALQQRYQGIPSTILQDPELLQLFLPAIRADITVADTYRYMAEVPLTCPISAYGGIYDEQVTVDELRGWQIHTQGAFGQRQFPGNHFYLQDARAGLIPALVATLRLAVPLVATAF